MRIVEVENISRTLRRIVLEDGFWLANAKMVERLQISEGDVVESSVLEELGSFTRTYAQERALEYISFKRRTEGETIRQLKGKRIPAEVAAEVVEKMKRLEFLNDEMYALDYINEMMEKNRSTYEIKMKLIKKGVSPDLVEKALETLEVQKTEMGRALESLGKKYGKMEKDGNPAKMVQYLYRKGFSTEAIRKALEIHCGDDLQ